MTGYVIEVRGTPAPQGSKRHIGGGRMIEMSKAVGPWREAVRAGTMKVCDAPLTGPVRANLYFFIKRPASHYGRTGLLRPSAPGHPGTRPDIDKLVRAVFDGLTMGGAWRDDGQVAILSAIKRYVHQDAPSGCRITIEELDQ